MSVPPPTPPPPPPLLNGSVVRENRNSSVSVGRSVPPPPPPPLLNGSVVRDNRNSSVSVGGSVPPPPSAPPILKTVRGGGMRKDVERGKTVKRFEEKIGCYCDEDQWDGVVAFMFERYDEERIVLKVNRIGTSVIMAIKDSLLEMLGNQCAEALGLIVPNMRVIESKEEIQAVKAAINDCVHKDEKEDIELDDFEFIVSDFVGKSLDDLDQNTLNYILSLSIPQDKGLCSIFSTRSLLRDIGEMIAFDHVLNIPHRQSYTGQLDLSLFKISSRDDSIAITPILNSPSHEFRLSVSELRITISTIIQAPDQISEVFLNIRNSFISQKGCDIGHEGILQIQIGYLKGLLLFLNGNLYLRQHIEDFESKVYLIKELEISIQSTIHRYPIESNHLSEYNKNYTSKEKRNVKVLIIQSSSSYQGVDNFMSYLNSSDMNGGRTPDFVLFPETFIPESGVPSKEKPFIDSFCEMASKYNMYVSPGTMSEYQGSKSYCTMLTMFPDEHFECYRKRCRVSAHGDSGDSVGIYESEFGKFGVVICFDAENEFCMNETLAESPLLILNPTFINGSSIWRTKKENELPSQWVMAISQMSDKFEARCRRDMFSLIRSDIPTSSGMGSSQIITPYYTKRVVSHGENYLSSIIDLDSTNFFYGGRPEYDRTLTDDNTGNRYNMDQIPSTSKKTLISNISNSQVAVSDGKGISIWNVNRIKKEKYCTVNITFEKIFLVDDIVGLHNSTLLLVYLDDEKGTKEIVSGVIDAELVGDSIIAQFSDHLSLIRFNSDPVIENWEINTSEELKLFTDHTRIFCFTNNTLLELSSQDLKVISSYPLEIEPTSLVLFKDDILIGTAEGKILNLNGITFLPDIHTDTITKLYSFHNRYILTSSLDQTMVIYDTFGNFILHRFNSHTSPIIQMESNMASIITLEENQDIFFYNFIQNKKTIGLSEMLPAISLY